MNSNKSDMVTIITRIMIAGHSNWDFTSYFTHQIKKEEEKKIKHFTFGSNVEVSFIGWSLFTE